MGSLVDSNPEYVALSEVQEQLARASVSTVGQLIAPIPPGTARFHAFFDGTNNSLFNPEGGVPAGEQSTCVFVFYAGGGRGRRPKRGVDSNTSKAMKQGNHC